MPSVNLTGTRFGRLLVLHLDPSIKLRTNGASWLCQCDCGKNVTYPTHRLIHNKVFSCGCGKYAVRKFKNVQEQAINYLYKALQHRAKKRNLVVELTIIEFKTLIIQPCHYCGSTTNVLNGYKNRVRANGIDRLDSFKDYTIDNCVSCCTICNRMKLDLSEGQFIEHIKRILIHHQ